MEPCVHFVVAKLFQVFFVMKGSYGVEGIACFGNELQV